ncbi:MAG: DUF4347 domain-containing protein [Bacteriovoracia bacterium]
MALVLASGIWINSAIVNGLEVVSATDAIAKPMLESHAPIVIVDGFEDQDDPMRLGAFYFLEIKYKNRPNVFYINPRSAKELKASLEFISQNHGPIGVMEYVAHGSSWTKASLQLGQEDLTVSSPDKTDAPMEQLSHSDNWFAPKAVIRIYGCMIGAGQNGDEFADQLGHTLLNDGGTVVCCSRIVSASPSDFVLVTKEEMLSSSSSLPAASLSKWLSSGFSAAWYITKSIREGGSIPERVQKQSDPNDSPIKVIAISKRK